MPRRVSAHPPPWTSERFGVRRYPSYSPMRGARQRGAKRRLRCLIAVVMLKSRRANVDASQQWLTIGLHRDDRRSAL